MIDKKTLTTIASTLCLSGVLFTYVSPFYYKQPLYMDLLRDIDRLNSQIDGLNAVVDEQQSGIAGLQSNVDYLNASLVESQSRIDDLNATITDLQNKNSELENRVHSVEENVNQTFIPEDYAFYVNISIGGGLFSPQQFNAENVVSRIRFKGLSFASVSSYSEDLCNPIVDMNEINIRDITTNSQGYGYSINSVVLVHNWNITIEIAWWGPSGSSYGVGITNPRTGSTVFSVALHPSEYLKTYTINATDLR